MPYSLDRRTFLTAAGAASAAWLTTPLTPLAAKTAAKAGPVRFGVITDLHHGYAPDALGRLQAFIVDMKRAKPDFIIEMGDFCNRAGTGPDGTKLRAVWDQFAGPRYHVLGNHDFDLMLRPQVLQVWDMKAPYYSFDHGPFHFVVLDCNYIVDHGKAVPWKRGHGYGNLLPPEELAWLANDLAQTDKQTVIFSHQGLDERGVTNRREARKIIAAANAQAGFAKVVACFCGHYHLDGLNTIEGVHYLEVNSASYYYVGGRLGNDGSARAAYRDPLFALVTLDPAGTLSLQGRKSEFRHPTPQEKKVPGAESLTASILDRKVAFAATQL
jgi:3',5'-cyclic AMP phosphodiesterase CpdA